jgi:glycosyltransferase involved in cell wall biosynthesis
MARLLAEHGEDVHVIAPRWDGADRAVEEDQGGRLVVHRVPVRSWTARGALQAHPEIRSPVLRGLFDSGFYPQCFGWQASLLAEKLVGEEGIDVVEGEEFEAPLYFFQLRRALGLGPDRTPPCIVHLHSPTEFIVRYNDWDLFERYFQTAARLEHYTIRAADALLCPSRYLARQVEHHYSLAPESVETIPLPLGDTRLVERGGEVWESGTVCYVGRLERRKGVLEWLDAAVAVAREDPTVRFEFVGANILQSDGVSARTAVDQRIPEQVRSRFLFRGPQPRAALPSFLARARVGVVPSRWENFPYACMEAMASGVPVIVSPAGGMPEMVRHGRSGWVAASGRSADLAGALRQALATPASRVAEMGRQAAHDIGRLCDPERVLEAHLRLRERVARGGARTSIVVPRLTRGATPRCARSADGSGGIAIVVSSAASSRATLECLDGIRRQRRDPAAVIILDRGVLDEETRRAFERERPSWTIVPLSHGDDAVSGKNACVDAVLALGARPIGFAFLDEAESLSPHFVELGEAILRKCHAIGLVSFWYSEGPGRPIGIRPCPAFPYQWIANDACSFSVVRTEALLEAGRLGGGLPHGYERWDLANAVMAAGWLAVTVPEIMGTLRPEPSAASALPLNDTHRLARARLLSRFTDLTARDAADLVGLAASLVAQEKQREIARLWNRQNSLYPLELLRTARRLAWRIKRALRRAAGAAQR